MDTCANHEVPAAAPGLGRAWTALALALLLHVIDEAATGFLSVYNPTVSAMRERVPWLPLPVFRFDVWLGGLLGAVVLLLVLRRTLVHGVPWMRRVATVFAVIMIANAVGHVAGTVAGRTVEVVHFPRPMPGFWSSPILAAVSVWVLVQLRLSRPQSRNRAGTTGTASPQALRPS